MFTFKKKYDYVVVGAGLFGATFARQVADVGKKVLIIEKQNHVAGHIYTKLVNNIHVHCHGPHIFHTSNPVVWKFVNRFAEFNQYKHLIKAQHKGKLYSLPFNLATFMEFWGCTRPEDAKQQLQRKRVKIENPSNFEEVALSRLGEEIYHTLVYGYTKKQWGREPRNLDGKIAERIPIRFSFDSNYYYDKWQGIPINGYTEMVENMIDHPNIEIHINTEFGQNFRKRWRTLARKLVYTGSIDEFFDYEFGELEYRTLRFQNSNVNGDFQGLSQMNYTDEKIPYTRIIEHKHFCPPVLNEKSIITFEYPEIWVPGKDRYYPIGDSANKTRYEEYKREMNKLGNVICGGRMGQYKYLDMHQVIQEAIDAAKRECKECSRA